MAGVNNIDFISIYSQEIELTTGWGIWSTYIDPADANIESVFSVIVSNLTITTFLIGTKHFPDLKGKIIIFEDINEDLYKIDRMLTYLRMTKIFSNIAGIGFGSFSSDPFNLDWKDSLKALILERLK